jgi:hypothetical protein
MAEPVEVHHDADDPAVVAPAGRPGPEAADVA